MKSTEGVRRGLPKRLLAAIVLVSCASLFVPHPAFAQGPQQRQVGKALRQLGRSASQPSADKARSGSVDALDQTKTDAPSAELLESIQRDKAARATMATKQERADELQRRIAASLATIECRPGDVSAPVAPDESIAPEKTDGTVNEVEPNNSPGTAQFVGSPEVTILGAASTDDATTCGKSWDEDFEDWEDWYTIQVNSASVLQIHLGGFGQTDFDVALVAATPGQDCAGFILGYAAQGIGVEEDLVVAVDPGRYTVAVTAFDLDSAHPRFSANYAVEIKAFSRGTFRTATEVEVNNSPDAPQYIGNSNLILTGQASTSDVGTCGFGSDDWEDWYAITLPTDSVVQLSLAKFGNVDLDVAVHQAKSCGGRILAYGGTVAGIDEFVSVALGAGTYFIAITAYEPGNSAFSANYQLTVFVTRTTSASLIAETEPNDSHSSPQSLGTAGALVAFGSVGRDDKVSSVNCTIPYTDGSKDYVEDQYSFTVPFRSTVYLILTGFYDDEDRSGDLDLFLTRTGSCPAFNQYLAYSVNGAGVDEEIEIELDPGTYVVGISAYDGADDAFFRGYLLGVFLTTAPGSADLSMTATDGPDPVTSADQLAYNIRVANAGPNVGIAIVSGNTPPGTTFAGVFTPQGFGVGPGENGTGEFAFALGVIPSGGNVTCTVLLNVAASSGSVLNTSFAMATASPDPNTSNNAAAVRTSVTTGGTAQLVWSAPLGGRHNEPQSVSIIMGSSKDAPPLLEPGTHHDVSLGLGTGNGGGDLKIAASGVTGYKLYKSNQRNVRTSPNNIFATVPPGQNRVSIPVSSRGTYYSVTACYGAAESASSNTAGATVPGPTVTGVTLSTKKIVATGAGFTSVVEVFVDGIRFSQAAKVKGSAKVTQKGTLTTGQTLAQYLQPGRPVEISFRNTNGGISRFLLTP